MVKKSGISIALPLIWLGTGLFVLLLQAPGYYFRIQSWPFSGDLIEYFFVLSLFVFPLVLLLSFVFAFAALKDKSQKKLAFISIFLNVLYIIAGYVYVEFFVGHHG